MNCKPHVFHNLLLPFQFLHQCHIVFVECVYFYCVTFCKNVVYVSFRYVKDKRPTISPNFNFLGQLLEFEKELQSSPMEVDRSGLSEETSFKKKRMDVGTGERLNFELSQPAVVSAMMSPVTALSQLNFNQLSPLREHPSPTPDEHRATSVKAESSLPVASGSSTASSSASVVIRLGSKHSHGGLKRPLSGPPGDTQLTQSFDCGGSAKRPLARPRSITLPSTIQPLQGLCSPRQTDAVQPPAVGHDCLETTAAADSREHDRIIPETSVANCPSQTSVDQRTVNTSE